MNPALKLAAFAAALVGVFGISFAAGALTDDDTPAPAAPIHQEHQP